MRRELTIRRPRAEVFEFFSDAGNLEKITPTQIGFNILTPRPFEMKAGTLIDYELKLYGFPIKWRTEITRWEPPYEFEDRQLWGPYKQWIHRHIFTEPEPGVTLIQDEVRYRLPLEPLGDLGHFLVARELEQIFNYRQKTVAELIGGQASNGHSPQ